MFTTPQEDHSFVGSPADPVATLRLHNKSLYTKLSFYPELYVEQRNRHLPHSSFQGQTPVDTTTGLARLIPAYF